MNIRSFLISVTAISLSACTSVSYLEIPVYHSAPSRFPALGESILVVNNAVEQPVDQDSQVEYRDGKIQRIAFDRDSITGQMVGELGNYLYASELFSDVLIYDLPLRTDSLWKKAPLLQASILDTLHAQSGTDWVLSMDALTYRTVIRETSLPEFQLVGADLQIIVRPVFRLYKTGSYRPVKHYYLSDTLDWKGYGIDFKHAFGSLPNLSECLGSTVSKGVDKAFKSWLPYQEMVSRFYVRSPHSAMREAEDLFIQGKGEDAAIMWEYVFSNVKNQRTRFYAAYNLAVYYESIREYDNALKWIDESIRIDGAFSKVEGLDAAKYKEELLKVALSDKEAHL